MQEVMEVQGEQREQGEQGGGVGEEEVVGRRSSLRGAAPATPGGEEGGGCEYTLYIHYIHCIFIYTLYILYRRTDKGWKGKTDAGWPT